MSEQIRADLDEMLGIMQRMEPAGQPETVLVVDRETAEALREAAGGYLVPQGGIPRTFLGRPVILSDAVPRGSFVLLDASEAAEAMRTLGQELARAGRMASEALRALAASGGLDRRERRSKGWRRHVRRQKAGHA